MIFKRKGLKHKIEYIKRYRQIFHVFVKYGFGSVVEKLNLERYVESGQRFFLRKKIAPDFIHKRQRGAVRFRLALEELGPTFIKLGQVLSTRSDLLPLDYIKELKKLQDNVEAVNFSEIKVLLEQSLEAPIESVFDSVDEIPIGSASIAQAHRAVLKNGQEVVLKIKKPNVDEIVELDIEILYSIARLLKARVDELAIYDLVGLVSEFSKSIQREIDFTREGKNNDIVRAFFSHHTDTFMVPKIYWEYTKESLLVQELVHGTRLTEIDYNTLENREELSVIGAKILLKMILEDGFFHADPHPGNVFLTKDNKFVLIDYGCVGILDEEDQQSLAEIIEGVVSKDSNKILHGFKALTYFPTTVNEKALKADIMDILEKYYNLTIKNINMGKVIEEITRLLTQYKIMIPSNFYLLGRSLMLSEGVCHDLNPDFDMIKVAKPYIKKLLLRRYSPKRFYKEFVKTVLDYKELAEKAPIEIKEILAIIRDGKMGFGMKIEGLDRFRRTLDRIANRVSMSIVIAALIVGSSMLIDKSHMGAMTRTSFMGVVGYLFAVIFGIIMIVNIFRRDKY